MIYNVEWNDTIKREVRALNNEELVKIHGIANGDVLVQRGTMEREKLPFHKTRQKVMAGSFS